MWSSAIKVAAPYILGLVILIGIVFGVKWWGESKYEAGRESFRVEVEAENARLTEAMQLEKDRADANYRGAVLAREAAEATIIARDSRIAGLLNQLRTKQTPSSDPLAGIDGDGTDWIGLFASCYGEYSDMGREAARLADKVGGLQEYVEIVQEHLNRSR